MSTGARMAFESISSAPDCDIASQGSTGMPPATPITIIDPYGELLKERPGLASDIADRGAGATDSTIHELTSIWDNLGKARSALATHRAQQEREQQQERDRTHNSAAIDEWLDDAQLPSPPRLRHIGRDDFQDFQDLLFNLRSWLEVTRKTTAQSATAAQGMMHIINSYACRSSFSGFDEGSRLFTASCISLAVEKLLQHLEHRYGIRAMDIQDGVEFDPRRMRIQRRQANTAMGARAVSRLVTLGFEDVEGTNVYERATVELEPFAA